MSLRLDHDAYEGSTSWRDGVRMVLVCPPGPVQRLLVLTRLDGRLALEPDRASALARTRSAQRDADDG